jgi:NAD(P)-dependent dehydrogenase (short-subunit alcohol dehydrogenase family)
MSDYRLDGKVAIVTGGSRGIGEGISRRLADAGAAVAVVARNVDDVERVAAEINEAGGGRAVPIPGDVTDWDALPAIVERTVAELGGIDILVNNAGIGAVGDVTENGEDEWHRVLDVNVVGIARVTRAAMPHLRESPHAVIVNTCSVVATVGVPQRAVYAASKGAVAALTLAMAADHVADGVRVNAVTPGTADTPWVERLLEQSGDAAAAAEALRARQPMGRLVTADEVAYAIAYLASPMSGSTTGTILSVDGGMSGLRLPR